ncbi:MAG: VWA domain-containing protein [Armatimonadota bacterium]|nr:VWA domain-containing protein [Armatimonadota bacterium]
MSFLSPAGLWWLAAIPLVVLLYWLRPRRVPVVVPSLVLWRRSLREEARRRPLRRFERNVLLLVQVLAVAAAALSLARPQDSTAGAGDVVVVLDVGLRMQATDVPPSRFEAARGAALKLLAGLRAVRVGVVAAARSPRVVQPLTTSRSDAVAAVRGLRPTDGASDLEGAVAVARSLSPSATVYVFSDRPVSGLHSSVFGGALEDVAITGVVASPLPGDRMRVTVTVRNGTSLARRVPVSVLVQGRSAAHLAARLAPGQQTRVAATVPAGLWVEARIAPQDALAATDRSVALGTQLPRPRVLMVGPPDPFLEAGLRAVAAGPDRQGTPDPRLWGRFDVVVLHRVQAPLPPGNFLLVASVPTNLPVRAVGRVREDVVRFQSRTHPLLRFVDLTGARVVRAWPTRPHGGEVLAEGEAPLLWAYEAGGLRAVLLPFSPSDSDLVLRPDFPILLANAVDWLAGPTSSQLEAGTTVSVPAGGLQEAVLHGPEGSVRLRAAAGRFVLPPFDRAGVYLLEAGTVRRVWAVRPQVESGTVASTAPAAPGQRAQVDWGRWLVGLFVALLVAEGWLFSAQARVGRT